jgi:hypothetical protein
VLAFINSGNRDVLILKSAPSAEGLTFVLSDPSTSPGVLKPQEIKLVSYSGTINIEPDAMDGERPLMLSHEIIAASGYDQSDETRIGSIIILGKEIVGNEILKFPVRLH